jgi:hypothetical protein
MQRTTFDPYGEAIELADGTHAPSTDSRRLTHFGTGLFWVLVVAIVGARAIYFDPGMLQGAKQVVAFLESLTKVL